MFDDHLDREQALLDFKSIDFTQLPRWFFLKPSTIILVKNYNPPLCLFQDKMGLEIVFDDCLGRKQAVLDYKIMYITQLPY